MSWSIAPPVLITLLVLVWLLQSYGSNKAFSIVYIVVSLSENSYMGLSLLPDGQNVYLKP